MLTTLQAASKAKRKTVLKLRAGAFKFPRPSPWRYLLSSCDDVLGKVIERREISRLSAIRSRGEHGLGDDIKPISFPLECPRCHTVSNMVRCRLYHLNRSRRIRCPSKQCKLTSTASKWQCPCGSSWMRCVHHRGPGFKCGCSKPSSSKATSDAAVPNISKRIKIIGPLGMHAESAGRVVSSTKQHESSIKTSPNKMRSIDNSIDVLSAHRFFARNGPYGQKKTSTKFEVPCNSVLAKGQQTQPHALEFSASDANILRSLKWDIGNDSRAYEFSGISFQAGGNSPQAPNQRHSRKRPSSPGYDTQPETPRHKLLKHVGGQKASEKCPRKCKGLCPRNGWTIDQFCMYCHDA